MDIIIILQWGIYQYTKIFGLVRKSYLYTIQKNIRWSRLLLVFEPKKYTNSLLAIKKWFRFQQHNHHKYSEDTGDL